MLVYKERGRELEKSLSPFLNIIYQRLKYCHLFIKWGSKSKTGYDPCSFCDAF